MPDQLSVTVYNKEIKLNLNPKSPIPHTVVKHSVTVNLQQQRPNLRRSLYHKLQNYCQSYLQLVSTAAMLGRLLLSSKLTALTVNVYVVPELSEGTTMESNGVVISDGMEASSSSDVVITT